MPMLDIISPLPPYPPHAGGTAHIFHASRHLSPYFDVSLFTLTNDPATVAWGPMPEWCREVHAFPRSNRQRSAFSVERFLDPPAVHQDWSPALAAFLRERWAKQPADIVQLEFTTMAQYAPLARAAGAVTVCTAHNVAFLAQIRRAQQEPNLRLRVRRWLGALSLWQYELRALRQCDLVVVHGVVDGNMLRRWLKGLPVVYVPSGIDLEQWKPRNSRQNYNQVLFVGNYAHPPNVEGAFWLAREVWPLVRRVCPQAHLTLAGRAPPKELLALVADDISVPGTVEDLQALYTHANAVVAPIFWGSGVRVKILEALACALPVITTPLAAEGIKLRDGYNALFATTAEEFAAAICNVLEHPELGDIIGKRGRIIIERSYDWNCIARRLAGLYKGVRHN